MFVRKLPDQIGTDLPDQIRQIFLGPFRDHLQNMPRGRKDRRHAFPFFRNGRAFDFIQQLQSIFPRSFPAQFPPMPDLLFRSEPLQHTLAFRREQGHDPGRIQPDVIGEIAIVPLRFPGPGPQDDLVFGGFPDRQLRRLGKKPERVHFVSEKFDPDRSIFRRGKNIHQTAPARKFAFLNDLGFIVVIHPGQDLREFFRRQCHAAPDDQLRMTHPFRIRRRRKFRRCGYDQDVRRIVQHPVQHLGPRDLRFQQFASAADSVGQQQNVRRQIQTGRPLTHFQQDLFAQSRAGDFQHQTVSRIGSPDRQHQQRRHRFIDRTDAVPGKNRIFQPFF